MKLKDFVKDVLIEIEHGINETAVTTQKHIFMQTMSQDPGENGVEFDVAVTAANEASGKIGAEVLSLGAKAEGKISNEEVSRIRFRVIPGLPFSALKK